MWFAHRNSGNTLTIITPLETGVRVATTNNTGQFQQELNLPVGDYILIAEISNFVGSGSMSIYDGSEFTRVNLSNGIISVSVTNKAMVRVYFELDENTSIDILYADLFEGSIAYPHVKEDYAIALTRCLKRLKVFNLIKIRESFRTTSDYKHFFGFTIDSMYDVPSLSVASANIRSAGNYENIYTNLAITQTGSTNNYVEFSITSSDAQKNTDMLAILTQAILSCEPK